ncbi:MAG: hypothetical protein HRT88_02260, partial [Lentisphaeraceae bacterium]|nr:hypothetical protein [Lentisphaeraceae bacterium]
MNDHGVLEKVEIRASWFVWLTLFCSLPLIIMMLGGSFASSGASHFHELTEAAHEYSLEAEKVKEQSVAPVSLTQKKRSLINMAHVMLSGSFTHTLLEWAAVSAAIFIAILAFLQFQLSKEASLPVLGVALACAGMMDAFHTFAADRLIFSVGRLLMPAQGSNAAQTADLIPFTWAICRLFNSSILLIGVSLFAFGKSKTNLKQDNKLLVSISLIFIGIAYIVIFLCSTADVLPKTMFADSMIKRPYDLMPILPYLICGLYVFPKYYKKF